MNKRSDEKRQILSRDEVEYAKPLRSRMTPVSLAVRAVIYSGALVTAPHAVWGASPGAADEGSSGLEEVIVTAQRRAENVQNVPISIQVLDTKALEELNVNKFADYINYLPSVASTGANPGFNATVVVRGIVTDGGNIASGSLPTVGQYLDEQPITTIDGALDLHMYDIARVEQLNGPQGTLFGASSMGGVLRTITNKPDPSRFSAKVNVEYNRVADGAPGGQVEGFVNTPIGERAALRVVGWYTKDGGFIDNVPGTRTFTSTGMTINNYAVAKNNYNWLKTLGGRAALAIPLGEHWTVTPSVIAQRQERNGSYSYIPEFGDLKTSVYTPEDGLDKWYQAALTATGQIGTFDVIYAGSYLDRKTNQHINYADYAYYYDKFLGQDPYFYDNAGNPLEPRQTLLNQEKFIKNSQEIRISSPSTDRLRFLAGLYYQRQFQDIDLNYFVDGLTTVPNPLSYQSVTGRPGAQWLTKEHRIDYDYAAFGELSFDLTSKLTLTGGLRAYRYKNSLAGFFGYHSYESNCIGPAIVPDSPCSNIAEVKPDGSLAPREVSDNGTTYRLNAQYQFTPEHMLYVNVSNGFRPGGTNRLGPRGRVSGPSETVPYTPDTLTNYEVGSKNVFFDRHATVNLTAFDEEWRDIQLTITINGVGFIQNAGKARSRGLEFSGGYAFDKGLTLTAAATYTDARLLSDYSYNTTISAPKGTQLAYAPPFKGNLIARYKWDIRDYGFYAQLGQTYQSSSWSAFTLDARAVTGKLPAYGTTNLSFGGSKGDYTIDLYVSNLTDRRAATYKAPICYVSPECGTITYTTWPRTMSLRLGKKF